MKGLNLFTKEVALPKLGTWLFKKQLTFPETSGRLSTKSSIHIVMVNRKLKEDEEIISGSYLIARTPLPPISPN